MLVTIRDTTFVIAEIFAWHVGPRYTGERLSPREISEGDDFVTTVWCRPFHLSFSVIGDHAAALQEAVTRHYEGDGACSFTSMPTDRRPSVG